MDMFDIPIMVLKDAISEANWAGMATEEQACRAALAVLEAADKVDKVKLENQFENGRHGSPCRVEYCVAYNLLASLPNEPASRPDEQAGGGTD